MRLNHRDQLPAALADLAQTQRDVVRRDQLHMISRDQLQAQLDGLRWQSIGPSVVVLHNGELTPEQLRWAAVLHAGSLGSTALAAWTAAEDAGLDGWSRPTTHVLVRRGVLVPKLAGVAITVHESRRFEPERDVHPTATPPRTRVERSLIDAAAWSPTGRAACGILAASVQQRLTTADRLLRALDTVGAINRRRLLASCLVDIGGGAQAVSELDFLRFCRRHGLPQPRQQVVRLDAAGRRRYLDAVLVGPNKKPVRVEIDGALHLVALTYWSDMARDNELYLARSHGLRFPSFAVRADDPVVVDQLRRALGLAAASSQVVSA